VTKSSSIKVYFDYPKSTWAFQILPAPPNVSAHFIHVKPTFCQCLENSKAFQVLPLSSLCEGPVLTRNIESWHLFFCPRGAESQEPRDFGEGAGAKREVKGLNNASRLEELLTDL
jgi:hypothetical protein